MPEEVKPYLSEPTEYINFNFFNPTDALAIMLCLSPLAATDDNLQLFARHSPWERMHRVENSLPEGCAALSSVLFFDGILRDAKGRSHRITSRHIA